MRRIVEFFARRHLVATLLTVMVILLGVGTAMTLKRDIFPQVDFGMMIISTAYPGASPSDVELNVTNKIEDQLRSVTGIDSITSVSLENSSTITVVLEADLSDPDKTKNEIREAVARITQLPAEVTDAPLVTEIDTSMTDILEVAVTGDLPYAELREQALAVEAALLKVPGVSRVERWGYRAREVQVAVDPAAIDRYQIPLHQIVDAIERRNIRSSGGTFESFTDERTVVTMAQFRDTQEVGEVIVRSTFSGPAVRIRDLAVVEDGFEEAMGSAGIDGTRGISLRVYKSENADIIRTIRAIDRRLSELAGDTAEVDRSPVGEGIEALLARIGGREDPGNLTSEYRIGNARVLTANDLSYTVRNRFQITLANGVIGLALVLLTLALFLNLRSAFWVALGIPISILGVFFLLPIFGSFLDGITLTSLVLLIGIIVDDGIIVSENITRRYEEGEGAIDAAVNGLLEVYGPVVTTILTTFLAFAPMFFMPGVLGRFVGVIPLTVTLALFVSLIEITIGMPAHLARGLERRQKRAPTRRGSWFEPVRRLFQRALAFVLRLRYAIIAAFIVVVVLIVRGIAPDLDFILFPSKGAERFVINLEMPTGTSLAATEQYTAEVERVVDSLPKDELISYITRIGAGLESAGENIAVVLVQLTPYAHRTRDIDQIIESLRPRIEEIEAIRSYSFLVDTGGPGVGKPITFRVAGDDDRLRAALVDEITAVLDEIDGVKDIERDDTEGKEQVRIVFDYARLARLGLTVADVAQTVRIAFDGEIVTTLREGREDVGFRVMLTSAVRSDTSFLENLSIPNREGRLIKLREVATLESSPGPAAVRHYDGTRTTTVTAEVDQAITTPLDATRIVQERIAIADWSGLELSVGGEAQESADSLVALLVIFVAAAVAIYFLLVLLFDSFVQPLLVMIAVPFGLVGVMIAFWYHDEPLSFLAMMGTIGLAGVVVNDSLVLVSRLNTLRAVDSDRSMRALVSEGTADRLRAVLLTTITTVAGLLPLAYGFGGTDLYMQPMALALGWGLIFATPLTLLFVPSLYLVEYDIRRVVGWIGVRLFPRGARRSERSEKGS